MKLDRASFTIFDVETTGLYPYSGDRICEIGALRVGPKGKMAKRFHSLVDPKRPISYGAFSVNGITDCMVKGKPTIRDILPNFLKFIDGSVLVAYNAGFDLGFIECALGEDRQILEDYYIIDALRLARRLFPAAGRYNLKVLCDSLGIRSGSEHRAMADVLMTWKVFEKELNLLRLQGVATVEDIAAAQTKRPALETVKDYKMKLIEEAIREEKRLNITYRSVWNNLVTERIVTPKKIHAGYDRSYLVAHCHLKDAERNFRLDCILDAKVVK